MAMGRSGTLALTLAVAASLLQLLLLLPPPVSSLPARPPPKISWGGSLPARPPPKIPPPTRPPPKIPPVLKDRAQQAIRNPSQSQHKKDDDQLGTGAADTFGPIVYKLSVGTPPAQSFTGIMDITSQFVWVTFQPRLTVPCSSQTCRSVLNQTCADYYCWYEYDYLYGDTSGYLATDTFTFGTTPVTGMVFGCSGESAGDLYLYGAFGVIAFGRGPLSFVSRLQPSRFSYFLAPNDLEAIIRLGRYAVPQNLKRSRSTPLLNSIMYPSLYYVKLTGIQVDGKDLNDIPADTFDLRPDGSGGVFLSTTTPITYLEQAAYDAVKRAFVSRIQLQAVDGSALLGLDLCYSMQSMEKVRVPRLTLVFDGAAAAMELKTANYFFKDSTTRLECLTIMPSLDGSSLLGSLLQTGKTMIYDLDGAKLTFETAGAAAPPAQVSSLMIIAPCFLVLWVLLC